MGGEGDGNTQFTPLIDVLLPVRNAGSDLAEAVASVRAQTERSFRLHVLDDGSTDGCIESLGELNDDRIRIYRLPPRGVAKTLNSALPLVTAPYVARVDADDLCADDRFERQLALLHERKDLVIVGSAIQIEGVDGRPLGTMRFPPDDFAIRRTLPRSNPFAHPAVMIRTSALRAVNGYDERFPRCEDYATWVRLLEIGTGANLPGALVIRRYRSTSVSVAGDRDQLLSAAWMRVRLTLERRLPASALAYAAAGITWAVLPSGLRWRLRQKRFARS